MKVLFEGQVPKDLSFPHDNEDQIKLMPDLGRIALSDGASESFDSKTWARLLTVHFVRQPELNGNWLPEVIKDYCDRFDQAQMPWSKQSAFNRGSFATLLGIEHFSKLGTVDVLGVGDSIAVLLDGNDFVDSFPYTYAEEFQQRPDLFCTNEKLNYFLTSPDFFIQHLKTWPIRDKKDPVILCMTDALAEWALRNAQEGHPMWQLLSGINDVSELEVLVLRERQTRSMRIDDTTLVKLSFEMEDGNDRNELPNP